VRVNCTNDLHFVLEVFWAHSQNREKRLLASSYLSLRPSVHLTAWNNSAPTGRFFIAFEIKHFSKFNFDQNLTKIPGNLHENVCTFMIAHHWILLKMRNILHKICRENQNTFYIQKPLFQKSCHLWDCFQNMLRTDDNTVHVLCKLDNWGTNINTLAICNNYFLLYHCKKLTRKRFNFALHVQGGSNMTGTICV
jgi:hypothetical protein